MADCECMKGCPFFNSWMAQRMTTLVENMKQRLCRGDNTDCARHMVLRSLGKEQVPPDLVPNQTDRARKIIAEAQAASEA